MDRIPKAPEKDHRRQKGEPEDSRHPIGEALVRPIAISLIIALIIALSTSIPAGV